MALTSASGSLAISSLTLEHLSSVPKRNNDSFLLAYHHEQRRFLGLYASYGRTEIKSWNTSRVDSIDTVNLPAATPSKGVDNFVFGTPVLKARVSKAPFNLSATHIERLNSSHLEHAESSKVLEEQRPLSSKTSRALPPDSTPALHAVTTHDKILAGFKPSKPPKPRKRPPRGDGNIDEEHENRLAERQQRKKMKRDIIKWDLSNGVSDEEQVPKKPEKQQTKAQTGFALMHGFSATNVGKNRLTLDPLPRQNTGVFKKGKASNATKVLGSDAKKKLHSKAYFSESKFLNKKRGSMTPPARSKSHSTCSSAPKISLKKRTLKKHQQPSESDEQSEQSETPPSRGKKSRTPYNPNDSIVWDIEKQSSLHDSDGSSHMRQQTILINFPKIVNQPPADVDSTGTNAGTKPIPLKAVANVLPDNSPAANRPVSTISLAPSQSASQVGTKKLEPYQSSNYFKPAAGPSKHTSDTPFHLISDPSTKEYSAKHTNAIGAHLSHTDGLDPPSDYIGESVISEHAYDAMAIDDSHGSALVFDNPAAAPRNDGFNQEPSYWSEVNWADCDDACLSSNLDISNFPSIDLAVCYDSEFGMADIQSYNGDEDDSLKGFPMASDHSWGIFSYLGMYDNRPPYFSSTCLEGPYLEDTATDTESTHEPPPPDSFPSFYKAFNMAESEAFVDLDAFSEGGEEEPESYLGSSVHSAFEEDGDNIEADNFYQGRTLLYGLNPISNCGSVSNGLLCVEAEVAGLLKQNHWLPQKL